MLFRKHNPIKRRKQNIAIISLVMAMVVAITACSATKGSIVILENKNGTGFTMDFKKWSAKNKCELSLKKGDVLQVEVDRQDGKIALTISGKKGSQPYTGNNLETGIFTVTVAETDEYLIEISGKETTGKVIIKKVEREGK
ncbi:MAG: hypothetical protein GXW85_10000 [Clostridia bacterium]|nr:hypothetical protein [Clostridia bacterium]